MTIENEPENNKEAADPGIPREPFSPTKESLATLRVEDWLVRAKPTGSVFVIIGGVRISQKSMKKEGS